MASLNQLAQAAITTLRQKKKDASYEEVRQMVMDHSKQEITKPTYYAARSSLKHLFEETPPATTARLVVEPATPPSSTVPAGESVSRNAEQILAVLDAARKLVALMDGDKESAAKLIRSI